MSCVRVRSSCLLRVRIDGTSFSRVIVFPISNSKWPAGALPPTTRDGSPHCSPSPIRFSTPSARLFSRTSIPCPRSRSHQTPSGLPWFLTT